MSKTKISEDKKSKDNDPDKTEEKGSSALKYRWVTSWQHNVAIFLITLAVIAVDRITKFYIEEFLEIGESISVIDGLLSITRINNVGAAFGMLQGFNFLFIIAAIAVMGLFVYFYSDIVKKNYLMISSSLILGGTVGNMMDRLYFGYVIDYIDFSFWPAFNISDMALTVGVVMLLVYLWKESRPKKKEKKYERF